MFEHENEVLQATALPQVSPCAQRVEAWLRISQSGNSIGQAVQCFVRPGSLVVAWSPKQARVSPSILRVKDRSQCCACALRSSPCFQEYKSRTSSDLRMLISFVGLGNPALCAQRVDRTSDFSESRVSRWRAHDCHGLWCHASVRCCFLLQNHLVDAWKKVSKDPKFAFGVPTTVGFGFLLTVSRC